MKTAKSKLLVRIIIGLLTLAVFSFLFLNENGILKYLRLKAEIDRLDREIKISEEKLKALEAEIDSLNYSKDKIERVAREKYDMGRRNEKVFKVKEN